MTKTIPILRCPGPDYPAELVIAGVVFEVSDATILNLIRKGAEILGERRRGFQNKINAASTAYLRQCE